MDLKIKVAVCIIIGFMAFVIAFSCYHIGRQVGYTEGWNDAMKFIREVKRNLDVVRYNVWI